MRGSGGGPLRVGPYLADDVTCFVSFLDQKMLDKVTVEVSL